MQIYKRYLFNSLLSHFVAVVLIFEIVVGGNLLAGLLDKIAEGRYPLETLMPFLSHFILESLVFILPFSAMLAVILAVSQKYRDGEIYVAFSLGVGYRQLLITVLSLILPLLVLSWVLVMEVLPATKMHYEYLKQTTKQSKDISLVTPGKFISLGGNTVVFVEHYDREQNRLHNLFIARRTADEFIMETARYGEQKTEGDEKRLYLYDGRRYQGIPAETHFQTSQFQEHWIVLPPADLSFDFNQPEMLSFSQLWRSDGVAERAELQIRLAMPVSLVLLTLFVLLLSQVQPRRERHVRVAAAILVCLIYLNANALVGEMIVGGHWGLFPGVWGVHLLMLGFIVAIMARRNFFQRVSV